MTKYPRLNKNEMDYLQRKAKELDMVFKSPNDVLRFILEMGEKPKKPQKRATKNGVKPVVKRIMGDELTRGKEPNTKNKPIRIRVDDEVWEKMEAEAEKFHMEKVQPIDKLLKKYISVTIDDLEPQPNTRSRDAQRPGGRPTTRR